MNTHELTWFSDAKSLKALLKVLVAAGATEFACQEFQLKLQPARASASVPSQPASKLPLDQMLREMENPRRSPLAQSVADMYEHAHDIVDPSRVMARAQKAR